MPLIWVGRYRSFVIDSSARRFRLRGDEGDCLSSTASYSTATLHEQSKASTHRNDFSFLLRDICLEPLELRTPEFRRRSYFPSPLEPGQQPERVNKQNGCRNENQHMENSFCPISHSKRRSAYANALVSAREKGF